MTAMLIALAVLIPAVYIWMDRQYSKYADHPDRALWNRTNEEIQAEIDASNAVVEDDNH